jgi:hypothetical protein
VSKVYHADDATHARVREHCEKLGIKSKEWVDKILKWALDRNIDDPLIEEIVKDMVPAKKLLEAEHTIARLKDQLEDERAKKRPVYAKVEKKKLDPPQARQKDDGPKPWELEPFWKQKEKDNASQGTEGTAKEASEPGPPTVQGIGSGAAPGESIDPS